MSATVPTIEPSSLTVGDTWSWTRAFADYPAPTWTLSYAAIPATGTVLTIPAANSSGDFLVSVPATTTVNYAAGDYLLVGSVSNGSGARYEVYRGSLTLRPNTLAAYEYRSFWQIVLSETGSIIRGEAGRRDLSYSINGRSLTARSMSEILMLYDRALAEVGRENFAGRSRLLRGRFVSAR